MPTREHVREYNGMNRQQIMAELIVIHLQDHQNKRALSCSSFWWDKFYIYCTELYTELLKKIKLPVMNMANRAITRTFTDSNCFSYLLSLSLSLQCLVVSLKVPSSCTSLISGFFFSLKLPCLKLSTWHHSFFQFPLVVPGSYPREKPMIMTRA